MNAKLTRRATASASLHINGQYTILPERFLAVVLRRTRTSASLLGKVRRDQLALRFETIHLHHLCLATASSRQICTLVDSSASGVLAQTQGVDRRTLGYSAIERWRCLQKRGLRFPWKGILQMILSFGLGEVEMASLAVVYYDATGVSYCWVSPVHHRCPPKQYK